jgi:hypothetical protein
MRFARWESILDSHRLHMGVENRREYSTGSDFRPYHSRANSATSTI